MNGRNRKLVALIESQTQTQHRRVPFRGRESIEAVEQKREEETKDPGDRSSNLGANSGRLGSNSGRLGLD